MNILSKTKQNTKQYNIQYTDEHIHEKGKQSFDNIL